TLVVARRSGQRHGEQVRCRVRAPSALEEPARGRSGMGATRDGAVAYRPAPIPGIAGQSGVTRCGPDEPDLRNATRRKVEVVAERRDHGLRGPGSEGAHHLAALAVADLRSGDAV